MSSQTDPLPTQDSMHSPTPTESTSPTLTDIVLPGKPKDETTATVTDPISSTTTTCTDLIPPPICQDPSTPKLFDPKKFVPEVVPITQDNIDRVSHNLMGLLKGDDGRVEVTRQFLKKCQYPEVQLVIRHKEIPEKFPIGIPKKDHPPSTDIKCGWTFQGSWHKFPVNKDAVIKSDDDNYLVVRVEPYIDEEGEIKEAVCHTKSADDMEVWFRREDFRVSHPNWEIPKIPVFFNQKVWKSDVPYWIIKQTKSTKKKNTQQNTQQNTPLPQGPGQHRNKSHSFNQNQHFNHLPPHSANHFSNNQLYPGDPQLDGNPSFYNHNNFPYPGGQANRGMYGAMLYENRPRESYTEVIYNNPIPQHRSRDRSANRPRDTRNRSSSRSSTDQRNHKTASTRGRQNSSNNNINNPGYGGLY